MATFTHPDYDHEDMPLADFATQAPVLEELVNDLALDVQELEQAEARYWLGTLLIDGKQCQAQLVVTSIDSHFVDEG
jgi:hypothetical protein